ncbi:helix-turn-helix transcriptional regulator [Curtobacterium sp. RRHDQ10]|uniref:helix-turn-helix transcriptional regulator n=1 Tax=Curtobacterium phyllosphaerae TaxID=3413379 RepID=UPI003BF41B7D
MRVDTDDLEHARALLRRNGGDRLRLIAPRRPFRLRYGRTGDADVSLQTSSATALLSGSFDAGDAYVVLWLTAGEGAIQMGTTDIPLRVGVPVMLPPGSTRLHLDAARQNHIHFRAGFLDALAADLGLTGSAQTGSAAGASAVEWALPSWTAGVRQAAASMLTPQAPLTTAARRALNVELAHGALQTFARWSNGVPTPSAPLSARMRQAVEYVGRFSDRSIGTDDIAAAVGLSARGLQQAFHRELGTTPLAYLREVRLSKVRGSLLGTVGTRGSVAEIARRSGFVHLGRFSASYRDRFGELPSATLHP